MILDSNIKNEEEEPIIAHGFKTASELLGMALLKGFDSRKSKRKGRRMFSHCDGKDEENHVCQP
jgi:hypothetical protein